MMRKLIYSFVLLSTALFIMSACKKDKQDAPPEPPVVDVVSVITGKVFSNNAVAAGVSVVCKLGSTQVGTVNTLATGTYKFDKLTKAGVYELTFSKTGFATTKAMVTVVSTDKTGAYLEYNAVLMPEGVKQTVTTDNSGLTQAATTFTITAESQPSLSVATTVEVPSGTKITDAVGIVVKSPAISITPIQDINTTSATGGANTNTSTPIAVLECLPSGLKFDKPIPISFPSPTGEYEIKGLKLYYMESGAWTALTESVVFSDGNYKTNINHFSTYKIGVDGAVVTSVVQKEPFTINSIDNLNGNKVITITSIDVSNKSGYIYTTSVEDAIGSDITDPDKTSIVDFIKNSITSRNSGFAATNAFISSTGKYPMTVTINPGVRIDFKGYNEYLIETIKLSFFKNGVQKDITVMTKKAVGTSVSYNAYNRDHTGGSGSL